jgi:hypothetical protein
MKRTTEPHRKPVQATPSAAVTRRTFLGAAAAAAVAATRYAGGAEAAAAPDLAIGKDVHVAVPEKAIEESFRIAADLTEDMRRLAYQCYHRDGWLAVSDGKNGPQHGYDPRDFHFGPKCAAYLWGHDTTFAREMGRRIFQDQSDPSDGRLRWDGRNQCSIHLAQTAKHFSDYMVYGGQDALVRDNWPQMLKTLKWGLAHYDPDQAGLIEQGPFVPDHFWALLVGEPYNFAAVDHCGRDVAVVSSMEVYEWLKLAAELAAAHNLPESAWLKSRAARAHEAIETSAWDPDAGYYYLLYRRPERRWQHSILRINEESRELDVTPYYAALLSGNPARAERVAAYARSVLLDRNLFPMPLDYPAYCWISPNYGSAYGGIPGGCWEEGYYNCVRAWSECKMLDAVYEAVRRRSEAHARDGDCIEWYTQDKGAARGRDRYGISAAAHLAAIIEGLFGITPAGFGFDEINIWPNLPAKWAGQSASIRVTLPGNGFLEYTHRFDAAKKRVTLSVVTDRPRQAHFRLFAPLPVAGVKWNSQRTRYVSAQQAGGGFFVYLDRPIRQDTLEIQLAPLA